jgi:hypothetical protein
MDGLASPPPEEDGAAASKAAKLMGMKSSKLERRTSVKTKTQGENKILLRANES